MHQSPRSLLLLAIGLGVFGLGCQQPNETLPMAFDSAGTTVLEDDDGSAGTTTPSSGTTLTDAVPSTSVDLTLAGYSDLQAIIKQQSGRLVVVDVWSTSCLPCMREFPNLVELARKYEWQLTCISMNVDYIGLKSKPPESYLPKIQSFLDSQQAELINLASSESDRELLPKLEVGSLPAILIYDTQGQLVKSFTDSNAGDDGLTYAGDVIPVIEQMLEQ